MANPKILVIPGSARTGSHNVRLAALAEKELTLIDADVTPLLIYHSPGDPGIRPPEASGSNLAWLAIGNDDRPGARLRHRPGLQ